MTPHSALRTALPLRGFVVNGGAYPIRHFRWNVAHLVSGPGMVGNLLHNFFFAVAACDKIAISSNISAAYCFCHITSYGEEV
jgi:hypothetical protein